MHFINNQCVSLISKQSYMYLQTERYLHAYRQPASAQRKYAELGLSLGTDTTPCLHED